jgi:hypothetical protein
MAEQMFVSLCMATTTKHPTVQERIKQEDKNNAMKNAMMMRVLKVYIY